jgi:hypothetical protein
MSMKYKIDTTGNRTRNLPAFTAVPPLCTTVRKFYPDFFFFSLLSLCLSLSLPYKSVAIFWGAEQAMVLFGAPVNFNSVLNCRKIRIVVLNVRCHSIM